MPQDQVSGIGIRQISITQRLVRIYRQTLLECQALVYSYLNWVVQPVEDTVWERNKLGWCVWNAFLKRLTNLNTNLGQDIEH